MSQQGVVDLTDETVGPPVAPPPHPAMIMATVPVVPPPALQQVHPSPSLAHLSANNYARGPYYVNVQNRQCNPLLYRHATVPAAQAPRYAPPAYPQPQHTYVHQPQGYAHQGYAAPVMAPPEYLKVTFSLVSVQEFTARVDTGAVSLEILDLIRRIPGAKFDWEKKRWMFPLAAHDNLQVALSRKRCTIEGIPREVLVAAQLTAQRQLPAAPSSSNEVIEIDLEPSSAMDELAAVLPPKLLSGLAKFQQEAVQFVRSKEGRALIADEMGLGKTRTAIGSMHHWQAELRTLLCPEVIKQKQILLLETAAQCQINQPAILRALNKQSVGKVEDGEEEEPVLQFVIISYSLLCKLHDALGGAAGGFQVIVIDESHYMKSKQAQRTKLLLPMLHGAKRAILLSGTPALSRPMELFTQLHALAPKQWAEFKTYGKRYCVDKGAANKSKRESSKKSASWGDTRYKGSNHLQELHVLLTATLMIRRLKANILTQLPKKKRFIVNVSIQDEPTRRLLLSLSERLKDYQDLQDQHKKKRKRSKEDGEMDAEAEAVRLEKKMLLMQLFNQTGPAKMPSVIEHLDQFLSNDLNGKILIFAHHLDCLKQIAAHLQEKEVNFISIDGSTSGCERHARTAAFQEDASIRAAVLGITAAGIALTLTAASTVYFAELYWTPASLLQAEDRAHRMGQLRDVNVYYFLSQGTVDDVLWPLIRKKMQVLGELVEGQNDGDMAASKTKSSASSVKTTEEDSLPESKPSCGDVDKPTCGGGCPMSVGIAADASEMEAEAEAEEPEVEEDALQELTKELAREETSGQPAAGSSSSDDEEDTPPSAPVSSCSSVSSSQPVMKAAVKEEDADAVGAEEENEYETYLRRPPPVDQLARAYIQAYRAYVFQQQQRMKALQATEASQAQPPQDSSSGDSNSSSNSNGSGSSSSGGSSGSSQGSTTIDIPDSPQVATSSSNPAPASAAGEAPAEAATGKRSDMVIDLLSDDEG